MVLCQGHDSLYPYQMLLLCHVQVLQFDIIYSIKTLKCTLYEHFVLNSHQLCSLLSYSSISWRDSTFLSQFTVHLVSLCHWYSLPCSLIYSLMLTAFFHLNVTIVPEHSFSSPLHTFIIWLGDTRLSHFFCFVDYHCNLVYSLSQEVWLQDRSQSRTSCIR